MARGARADGIHQGHCASPAFRRSGVRGLCISRRAEAIVDEGRGTRLSDGAVIVFAVLVVVLVGVLVTMQTHAQSARTKAVAEAGTKPRHAGPLFAPAAVGVGAGRSPGMAQFKRLPRCVRRGVLLAAARDEGSLPRARPPCSGRPDRMPGRTFMQGAGRGGGLGHSWNDGSELMADGFADDSD